MTTKPTAEEIYNVINSNTYNYYGLRAVTPHPRTGKSKMLKVGSSPGVSYEWVDNSPTRNKLHGICALAIPYWAEVDDIQEIIDNLHKYHSNQIVLIGSYNADYGDDPGEVIMYDDAKILAEWR